jgi:hypothetical protein
MKFFFEVVNDFKPLLFSRTRIVKTHQSNLSIQKYFDE